MFDRAPASEDGTRVARLYRFQGGGIEVDQLDPSVPTRLEGDLGHTVEALVQRPAGENPANGPVGFGRPDRRGAEGAVGEGEQDHRLMRDFHTRTLVGRE